MNKKLFWLFTFLLLVAGTVVKAQLKKVPNIGYLRFIEFPVFDDAFRKGLRELGYVDGQNIRVEYRYAGGSMERLAEHAAELVSINVDVIVAAGTQ